MTPRPLLPPRGVFLPTRLVFDRQLNPSALQTWAQLRALAWGQQETPVLSLQQLTELTGKQPSTLYGHMAILRDRGALRWRPAGSGTLIVSFEPDLSETSCAHADGVGFPVDDFPDHSEIPEKDSEILENFSENPEKFSRNLEKPSLNPSSLDQMDSAEAEERGAGFQNSGENDQDQDEILPENEGIFQDSGKTLQESGKTLQDSGKVLQKSRKSLQESGKQEGESAAAVRLYRRQTRISPNPSQRALILEAVTDLDLWAATLDHWLSHGWSPRNLPGLLDLYARGGPAGCRYCQESRPHARSQTRSTLDQNLASIDDLRKELTHG